MVMVASLLTSSCHRENHPQVISADSIKEKLINTNKKMLMDEMNEIDDFILRHHWKMEATGTGLRYEIYQYGSGRKAELNSRVTFTFSVFLFDGTKCYFADDKNPLTIVIGHGEQNRGLEEGILLMHEGDKARLIVPVHLGYGMHGDENKIPGNSPLYYEVNLLKVNKIN
jgi:FKBP-type peptidyl-prolyl cis-trans isomerase